MTHVLVIDHDRQLCQQLNEHLIREGLTVRFAHDGLSGLASALSGLHDVVVVDEGVPELSGTQLIRRLRTHSAIGVLLLGVRAEEANRIVGLECGADDYLAKPFSPRELVAHIRAISRRLTSSFTTYFGPAPEYLQVGDLEMDEGARTCRRSGELIELTTAEFQLLSALLRCSGRVVHRKDLTKRVLDREYFPTDRSIDVLASNLRRKLGRLPDGTERICAVRSVGYMYARPVVSHLLASERDVLCHGNLQGTCKFTSY
jgi:DNA-binding response OmpR family regulator